MFGNNFLYFFLELDVTVSDFDQLCRLERRRRQRIYWRRFNGRAMCISKALLLHHLASELIPSLMNSWSISFFLDFYSDSFFFCKHKNIWLVRFQETYCEILVKYKSDLARPFDEATTFLNKIEMQLRNLCTGVESARGLSGKSFLLIHLWFSG